MFSVSRPKYREPSDPFHQCSLEIRHHYWALRQKGGVFSEVTEYIDHLREEMTSYVALFEAEKGHIGPQNACLFQINTE